MDIYARLENERAKKYQNLPLSNSTYHYVQLQVIFIQSQLLIIKSGDTDWEDYALSCETYENVDRFMNSELCELTLRNKECYNVSSADISLTFRCCQYNFSHSLAYRQIAKPSDKTFHAFYGIVAEKTPLVGENVACAIANARHALTLCKESLGKNISDEEQYFFDAIKFLNGFYETYCYYKNNNIYHDDNSIIDHVKTLINKAINDYFPFIPDDVLSEINMQK